MQTRNRGVKSPREERCAAHCPPNICLMQLKADTDIADRHQWKLAMFEGNAKNGNECWAGCERIEGPGAVVLTIRVTRRTQDD
jgi:hypothetical protein